MNLLTQREAAKICSVSVGTIAKWRKDGLRYTKLGNVLRIKEKWLAEFLKVDDVKVQAPKGQLARERAEVLAYFGDLTTCDHQRRPRSSRRQ